MEPLIAFLINLLLMCLVLGIVWCIGNLLIGAFGLPALAVNVLQAVLLLVLLFWVLGRFAGGVPIRLYR